MKAMNPAVPISKMFVAVRCLAMTKSMTKPRKAARTADTSMSTKDPEKATPQPLAPTTAAAASSTYRGYGLNCDRQLSQGGNDRSRNLEHLFGNPPQGPAPLRDGDFVAYDLPINVVDERQTVKLQDSLRPA